MKEHHVSVAMQGSVENLLHIISLVAVQSLGIQVGLPNSHRDSMANFRVARHLRVVWNGYRIIPSGATVRARQWLGASAHEIHPCTASERTSQQILITLYGYNGR